MSDKIKNAIFDFLVSPRSLLSIKGGLCKVIVLGFVLAIGMIWLGCSSEQPLCKNILLFGIPAFFTIVWFIGSQFYLRSGADLKIGIAFEGPVDDEEWKSIKKILSDLFNEQKISKKVTLRYIPEAYRKQSNKAARFQQRYKFYILASIAFSNTDATGKYNIRMLANPEYDHFIKRLFSQGSIIPQRFVKDNNSLDVLKAETLRDTLMLFIGTSLYHSGRYEDAAVILRYWDNTLGEFPINKMPRTQIRYLDMKCRLVRAEFPITQIPEIYELNQIRQLAESAECYFDEFPQVSTALARIRFIMGDIDGAIELTKNSANKVTELETAGLKVSDLTNFNVHLNHAFLSFTQGHWGHFCAHFNILLDNKWCNTSYWHPLVDFIDYVAESYGFDGIECLQVIYRIIAEQRPRKQLLEKAQKWREADSTRKCITTITSRCYSIKNMQKNANKDRRTKTKRKKRGK